MPQFHARISKTDVHSIQVIMIVAFSRNEQTCKIPVQHRKFLYHTLEEPKLPGEIIPIILTRVLASHHNPYFHHCS
jgi:hypothetical protein